MVRKKINNLTFFSFKNLLDQKGLTHFISTRAGGLSKFPYESLNLVSYTGDDSQVVLKNRNLLAKAIGIPLKNFFFTNQVHGSKIIVVASKSQKIPKADALITDIKNICLSIVVADCAPILFFDKKKKVIGACHAGFKGTEKSIAYKTVKALKKHFNSNPKDIIAGIGPSICFSHYEKIDLWEENKQQLLKAGILGENIEISKICTFENNKIFFSERFQKRKTGRFMAGIMLA